MVRTHIKDTIEAIIIAIAIRANDAIALSLSFIISIPIYIIKI